MDMDCKSVLPVPVVRLICPAWSHPLHHYLIPVIGVPVKTSIMSGVDSLYSLGQMPRGIPVVTVTGLGATRPSLRTHGPVSSAIAGCGARKASERLQMLGSDAFLEQEANR